jgi:iron(III) transport system permease protein
LPAAGVAVGIALIAIPFLAIAIRSVLVWSGDYPHPSAWNFVALAIDRRFGGAILNTLIAAVCTTAFSLVLGFCLAFLVSRTDMPARRLLGAANVLPLFLSPYAGAVAWTFLLAPHDGLITTWAREAHGIALPWLDIYSAAGVIFVLTLFHTPVVYWMVIAPLRGMDPALADTARVHGASFRYTLRHITMPLVLPALLSAALIVFVASAALIDVPLALGVSRGVRFVPTEIYTMVRGPSGAGPSGPGLADLGEAAAFGVVVLAASIALIVSRRRFLASSPLDGPIGGPIDRSYRRGRPHRIGWSGRAAALLLETVYLGCAVVLPLLALLMVSLTRRWAGRLAFGTMTEVNFRTVLSQSEMTRGTIVNSLIVAVAGATIGVALAVLQGYYLTRGDRRHRTRLELSLALPLGIPAVILALGWLVLTSRTPLHGTLVIILIAYLACYPAFVTRDVTASFRRIDPDLEQIARTSGAGWHQIMWHIVVPLVKPSLIASWLLLFVICFRELGATILLYAQGSETMSVAMVALSERDAGQAAALGVVQFVVLLLAGAIFWRNRAWRERRPA